MLWWFLQNCSLQGPGKQRKLKKEKKLDHRPFEMNTSYQKEIEQEWWGNYGRHNTTETVHTIFATITVLAFPPKESGMRERHIRFCKRDLQLDITRRRPSEAASCVPKKFSHVICHSYPKTPTVEHRATFNVRLLHGRNRPSVSKIYCTRYVTDDPPGKLNGWPHRGPWVFGRYLERVMYHDVQSFTLHWWLGITRYHTRGGYVTRVSKALQ